jgi:hypothetical protein
LLAAELEVGSLIQPFGPELAGLAFHFVYPDTPASANKCAALQRWLEDSLDQLA